MSSPPPPHDYDAERAIVGALRYRPDGMAACHELGLEPGHFYSPRYRRRYGQLHDAWLEGRRLPLAGDTDADWAFAPQVSRPDLYAYIILGCAARRRMLAAALELPAPPHVGWAEWAAAKRTELP